MDTTALNQAITDLEAECQSIGYTPVHLAAERGEHEIVSVLADGGANLNARTTGQYGGDSPLASAIIEEHPETVRVLVEKGANVKCWTGAFGSTPLFLVTETSQSPLMVKYLVDGGADLNSRNRKQETPLHRVAGEDFSVGILKVLLDNDADLSAVDKRGRTPRDVAVKNFKKYGWDIYKEIITVIDTHKAQVNSETRMTASTTRQKGLPEVMDGEIMAFLKH